MTVSLTARLLLAAGTAWMRAASVLDEDGQVARVLIAWPIRHPGLRVQAP